MLNLVSAAHYQATGRTRRFVAAFAAITLLSGCAGPTHDASKLRAIRAEAQVLMRAYPIKALVPKARWPRVLASFGPDSILVDSDGVHITTKPFFDGGWGYFIPRNERELPEPANRFEDAGEGVYWWHPY